MLRLRQLIFWGAPKQSEILAFGGLSRIIYTKSRISLDVNGEIKNCPSMPKSFGNIRKSSFLEASSVIEFKEYWSIKKDDIQICQDCEYHHMCTDCRAFTDNPDDNIPILQSASITHTKRNGKEKKDMSL